MGITKFVSAVLQIKTLIYSTTIPKIKHAFLV